MTDKDRREKDREELRWRGMLGHNVAVLTDDGKGGRRCVLESTDVERARVLCATEYAGSNPSIWCRLMGTRRWRQAKLTTRRGLAAHGGHK
jgi:hypothetical protein